MENETKTKNPYPVGRSEYWDVKEGAPLQLTKEAVRKLTDNTQEFRLRKPLNATGSLYRKFKFKGLYNHKNNRVLSLKQTLINLGLGVETDTVGEGFLYRCETLNKWELNALVEGLGGPCFFILCKFYFLQDLFATYNLGLHHAIQRTRALVQPVHFLKEKIFCLKKKEAFTLFGKSFSIVTDEQHKTILLEVIESLTTHGLDDVLYKETWNEDMNHSRNRVAKIILETRSDLLKPFCLKQLNLGDCPKRKNNGTAEETKAGPAPKKHKTVPVKEKICQDGLISRSSNQEEDPPKPEEEGASADSEDEKEKKEEEEEKKEEEEDLPEPEEEGPHEEAEETSIDVRERRTGSRELEYKGAHFQGKKVLAEYEKAVAERKTKVKVKKQTWFEVLFWSVAIFAMDLYLPYRDESDEQFLIGFFVGVAVVLRILFFSPHYFWTVVTILYIRWVDTNRFAFVPGEIYATVALQIFCMERKWAMMIPVTGFAVYCYLTGKHWSILIHYLVTLSTSLKAHRVDDGVKSIMVSPYKDSVLLVVAIFYTCLGGCSLS
jgi:hypothetical protein